MLFLNSFLNAVLDTVKIADQSIEVTENLLVVRKLKERFNKSVQTWPLYFDPRYLKLGELESDAKEPTYQF